MTIDELIAAVEMAVANGGLAGSGPGESAEGRLGAWRNMLVTAAEHLLQDDTAAACSELQQAYLRANGTAPPPDFVTGEAAPILASMIHDLMDDLGCP